MIQTLEEIAPYLNYSFVESLTCDVNATEDGIDYNPREIKSGHYVNVLPTPIDEPIYIAHSHRLFSELGFDDSLATSQPFMRLFSGDMSHLQAPFLKQGRATGYALSIYGTEYYDQCPFRNGNGYGDGRAISILEIQKGSKHYEMQLKGGGKTPYCRGADGRAVLRSSIREFLAQEHMAALGIATSRSLTLYTSKSEQVRRPWFREESYSRDPEVMILEDVAITTRVASSFLRVGQIELFGRRARKNEHPNAMDELRNILLHLMEREYKEEISSSLTFEDQLIALAKAFRSRLTSLVAEWIRVGYCQGNFNSDNTAAGGFTLDYGPFGFMELFDPRYQPWTGGGMHFSFLNQPQAAQKNFEMFCLALHPLLSNHEKQLQDLEELQSSFPRQMQQKMIFMWQAKLGLKSFDVELFNTLMELLAQSNADYTIFFRELSKVPKDIAAFEPSFYGDTLGNESLRLRWHAWLESWRNAINADDEKVAQDVSLTMCNTNPKYTLREWHLVNAYKAAQNGDYSLIRELQEVMTHPYEELSLEMERKYYKRKPQELFRIAGVSHISCSS